MKSAVPPSVIVTAFPEDAAEREIFRINLILASKSAVRNVLPVRSGH